MQICGVLTYARILFEFSCLKACTRKYTHSSMMQFAAQITYDQSLCTLGVYILLEVRLNSCQE